MIRSLSFNISQYRQFLAPNKTRLGGNQGVGFRDPPTPTAPSTTAGGLADDCLNGHKSQDYAPISWD